VFSNTESPRQIDVSRGAASVARCDTFTSTMARDVQPAESPSMVYRMFALGLNTTLLQVSQDT
jgi:hypothetical protein